MKIQCHPENNKKNDDEPTKNIGLCEVEFYFSQNKNVLIEIWQNIAMCEKFNRKQNSTNLNAFFASGLL